MSKDGVSLLMFLESASMASKCVANLKPVPQAEAAGQVNRAFHRKTAGCFSLLSVQCPGGGRLPRAVFLVGTVQWNPGAQAPLATRARQSKGFHCMDCTCLPASAGQQKIS